jgi:hypothetical protein
MLKRIGIVATIILGIALFSGAVLAENKACDRACLTSIAGNLLISMASHDPSSLPLSKSYAATENSQASSLNMMSLWRTVTGIKQTGQHIIDSKSGQIFFTAALDESGMPSLLMARLKVENRVITELELYVDRSRADSGFLLQPEGLSQIPNTWTAPVPEGRKASREELLNVGKAVFDKGLSSPKASSDCVLMEMGGVVYEDPDYLVAVTPPEGNKEKLTDKKLVTIPCGMISTRPGDPNARVEVVDEEKGIVVSFGVVEGFVSPYLTTRATESCFVPTSMIEDHRKYLKSLSPDQLKNRNILQEMQASVAVMEVIRYHSNQIQGMHRFMNLQGPGAGSPWVMKSK